MRCMVLLLLISGCPVVETNGDSAPRETAGPGDSTDSRPADVALTVTLDGAPVGGAVVTQGGVPGRWLTEADGTVTIAMDWEIEGDVVLHASHPEARIRAVSVTSGVHEIALQRFDPTDNEAYVFQGSGDPELGLLNSSDRCGHCHVTMLEEWGASPHATSASNPVLHDIYSGVVSAITTEGDCTAEGGQWREGIIPGTASAGMRCFLGVGALPDLNPGCVNCDTAPAATGACADCHAPGIDGRLGGRHLLEATNVAFERGVHCDVCHKVESIDLEAPAGVAGRLGIVRPSEETTGTLGPWLPLMFGPYHDVANPRMGSVQRDHYEQPQFCAGCHELAQQVLVPGEQADSARWPEGTLPIHTTWSELTSGPLSGLVCQDCHMPVDLVSGNSADLGNVWDIRPGIAGGWYREEGEVHRHAFLGPRQDREDFLESAARLVVDKQVDGDVLTASVTVTNARPPHAIPTGEPLRHLVVLVEARCEGQPLDATGGDVVPDYGGFEIMVESTADPNAWAQAQVGDVVRAIREPGSWVDYTGYGPFGDGRFELSARGLPTQELAGISRVTAVDGGVVTFEPPLPVADRYYLAKPSALPTGGEEPGAWAGSPGWAFARVLVDAEGNRMVPHHRAVDVVSDNRLLATDSWTSRHQFQTPCASPEVEAVLLYRPWPRTLASQRHWSMPERVVQRTIR